MQERPYWRSDEDDKDSTSSRYGSYGARAERPTTPPPAPEAPPEARPTVAPPLEGIISWRQNEELLEKAKASKHERSEDDDDDDEEESSDRPAVGRAAVPKKEAQQDSKAEDDTTDESHDEKTEEDVLAPYMEMPNEPAEQPAGETGAETNDDDNDGVAPPHTAQHFQSPQTSGAGSGQTPPRPPAPQPAQRFVSAVPTPEYPLPHAPAAETTPEPVAYFHEPAPSYASPQNTNIFTDKIMNQELPYSAPANGENSIHTDADMAEQSPPPSTDPAAEASMFPPPPPPERPAFQYGYDPAMYPPDPGEYRQPALASARTEQAVAPVDNHRHGEPLAVVAGIGLVAEHIGRKNADRRQQDQLDQLTAEGAQRHQEAMAHNMRVEEQQRQYNNEQFRQNAEMRRLQQAQQERYNQAPAAPYNLEQAASGNQQTVRYEAAPGQRPQATEQQPLQQPEHMPPVPAGTEQQMQEQYMPEAQAGQPGHVEHSAWHNIVVDKHGHEVSGAMHYGQEFHRQREHEMLQGGAGAYAVPGDDDTQSQGTQAQPALQPPYQQGQDALPSGMTNPILPSGPPTHADAQHQLPAVSRKQVASNIANPWFWLMLLLIVAAFFTAALI